MPRGNDFDFSDDERDDDRPRRRTRREDEPPRRRGGGMPGWAWALIVGAVVLVMCGGVVVVAVVMWSQKAANTPKQTPTDLHKSWAGRSEYDWFREFGDADRNDFHTGGGTYYYKRGAVSEKTGKPCGVMVRMDGGQVTWVAEWE